MYYFIMEIFFGNAYCLSLIIVLDNFFQNYAVNFICYELI